MKDYEVDLDLDEICMETPYHGLFHVAMTICRYRGTLTSYMNRHVFQNLGGSYE